MKLKELGSIYMVRSPGSVTFRDQDGNLHFTDGPAYIWDNGDKAWYVKGDWIRSNW